MTSGSELAVGETVAVEKRQYDGTVKHAWQGSVVRSARGLLVLRGAPGREQFRPSGDESLVYGSPILEYHWLDRWYSVFCLFEENGAFQSYYGDIRMPAELDGRRLGYVDLELDLIVRPDLSHEIVDEREFEGAARDQGYPAEVIDGAHGAVEDLLGMLRRGEEPFSSEVLTP